MILYVNGDSHTAAAEAVNSCAFAEDDGRYKHLGRLPHPSNLAASWGKYLSDVSKMAFKCDAESAASNTRIIRTTKKWLEDHAHLIPEVLFIIQWSTWEREEWLIDGTYYQINASGIDDVPDSHKESYKKWIADIDWKIVQKNSHEKIVDFYHYLSDQNARFVFFNGNNHFDTNIVTPFDGWKHHYVDPYNPKMTYNQWLLDHGYDTVSPKSWHFGQEAHAAWARFMLKYLVNNKLI